MRECVSGWVAARVYIWMWEWYIMYIHLCKNNNKIRTWNCRADGERKRKIIQIISKQGTHLLQGMIYNYTELCMVESKQGSPRKRTTKSHLTPSWLQQRCLRWRRWQGRVFSLNINKGQGGWSPPLSPYLQTFRTFLTI